MLFRLQRFWNNLQGSLWFIPILLVLSSLVVAYLVSWLDRNHLFASFPFAIEAGPDGARTILSTIASSVLTVASVAFSFTIVVFSFASSQYSSRTLHNFMDDNTNQVVLGVLLGSFVYCLLILSTVRLETNSGPGFVPVLSLSGAMILALVDMILFILYIHHVAETIQAYHIISRVGEMTIPAVEHIFPAHIGHEAKAASTDSLDAFSDMEMIEVCARSTGYVQMVDGDILIAVTSKNDLLLKLHKRVGSFVVKGETLAQVGPAERATPDIVSHLQYSFVLGKHRTMLQDPLYGILQLSDIAIKALSPAINDPNTAIMALNQLGDVLRRAAGKRIPSPLRADSSGKVRVIAEGPTFSSMAAQAFDQIRRYGMTDAAIPIKMLDVLSEVAEEVQDDQHLSVLRGHMMAVVEDAARSIRPERDRALINEKLRSIKGTLKIDTPDLLEGLPVED